MLKQLKTWLLRPYPIVERIETKFVIAFLMGVFIFLFLVIFQPFELKNVKLYKVTYFFGYGLITFLITFFFYVFAPYLLKNQYTNDKWNVLNNLLAYTFAILFITFCNWGYNSLLGQTELGEKMNIRNIALLPFLFFTISIGIIPLAFSIMIIEGILTKRNEKIALQLITAIQNKKNVHLSNHVILYSENKKDILKIDIEKFICIESLGNYVSVYLIKEEQTKKVLIRNSLTNLEMQVSNFELIKRCHRSYIVNLEKVKKVSGNARNYSLQMESLDFPIPVSRSFPKEVILTLKNDLLI